jgi:hypothetical protein
MQNFVQQIQMETMNSEDADDAKLARRAWTRVEFIHGMLSTKHDWWKANYSRFNIQGCEYRLGNCSVQNNLWATFQSIQAYGSSYFAYEKLCMASCNIKGAELKCGEYGGEPISVMVLYCF